MNTYTDKQRFENVTKRWKQGKITPIIPIAACLIASAEP
jgi:hypothetical protein